VAAARASALRARSASSGCAREGVGARLEVVLVEELGVGRAGIKPAALAVDHADQVGGVLGDQARPRLALAQRVARARDAAVLPEDHVADGRRVAERPDDREERHQAARLGLEAEPGDRDHHRGAGPAAAEEHPRHPAVHRGAERRRADDHIADPEREAEAGAPRAEQRRVDQQVVVHRARRVRRVRLAQVHEVRIDAELQHKEHPRGRARPLVPEVQRDGQQAVQKRTRPDDVNRPREAVALHPNLPLRG
jgi:hypothetical protein